MSITVTGILFDPMNIPESNVDIRITSLSSEVTLLKSEAVTTTGDTGQYSFTLVSGDFDIEANTTNEYKLAGSVRVTSGMSGTYTLPELLLNHTIPTEPE